MRRGTASTIVVEVLDLANACGCTGTGPGVRVVSGTRVQVASSFVIECPFHVVRVEIGEPIDEV